MTIIQTDFPEDRLLAGLLAAAEAVRPADDPGYTIVELADAWYGNHHGSARDLVSRRLKPAIEAGTVKVGWRRTMRVDGKALRVRVFSVSK